MLELKRIELNLDERTANQLIETARKASHRKTSLTAKDALTIKLIVQLIKENDIQQLKSQLPRLKVLAKTYQVEDVNYIYNMLMAALQPEELIKIYEYQPTDEYWQTFWASIAYLKINDVAGFEDASSRLTFYTSYCDSNELLLQVLSLSRDFGTDNEIVQETLRMLNNNSISSELKDFWQAICQCLKFIQEQEDIAVSDDYTFYIEHVVPLHVCKNQTELLAQRRQEAEEEAVSILTARKQKSVTLRKWIMAIGGAISFDEVEEYWNVTSQPVFSGLHVEEPTAKSISRFFSSVNNKDDNLILFHPQKAELLGFSKENGVGVLYFISRNENKYYSQYATVEMARPIIKDYFTNGKLSDIFESWQTCSFTDLLSQ